MGRFLEIAHATEHQIRSQQLFQETVTSTALATAPLPQLPLLPLPPPPVEPPFDTLASAVLDIVVKAGKPISHPALIRAMIGRGHDKTAARQAIARCQKRRWIGHNLETGYLLLTALFLCVTILFYSC